MPVQNAEERRALFGKMLEQMQPIFWDTEIDSLDMDAHSGYIISRLLNAGGMRGFIYVEDLYSRESIERVVESRWDLRPQVRAFMAERYRIPPERITANLRAWR